MSQTMFLWDAAKQALKEPTEETLQITGGKKIKTYLCFSGMQIVQHLRITVNS